MRSKDAIRYINRVYKGGDDIQIYTRKNVVKAIELVEEELLAWHDPVNAPAPIEQNIIVKYIANDRPDSPYYTIGRMLTPGVWDCEANLATYPDFKIIAWRPIHE